MINNTAVGSPTFDEVPQIDQTRYSPNVSQQLMATADREWVMYTITDAPEHVASAPCVYTPNICLIITIIHT